jgi:hypothetical protein
MHRVGRRDKERDSGQQLDSERSDAPRRSAGQRKGQLVEIGSRTTSAAVRRGGGGTKIGSGIDRRYGQRNTDRGSGTLIGTAVHQWRQRNTDRGSGTRIEIAVRQWKRQDTNRNNSGALAKEDEIK